MGQRAVYFADEDGAIKNWRIGKPIDEIKQKDIENLKTKNKKNEYFQIGKCSEKSRMKKPKSPCIDVCNFSGPSG